MMHTNETLNSHQVKATLSTLWIFILLNIIFRDIHEFVRPGYLQQVLTGVVNGNQITDIMLLLGGIMIEVPIAMILLARLLKDHISRWVNLIASPLLMVMIVINNLAPDMDDFFFAVIEVAALGFIFWTALKWKVTHSKSTVMA